MAIKQQKNCRPNILLCVFDSLAACSFDSSRGSFPALRKLQRESIEFTAAYTPCPESSPARTSLFTGLDPSVHGVWTNGVELPRHELTFPQILTQAGYSNWLVGRRQLAGVANWTTEHSRADEFEQMEWAHGPLHRSRQNAYLNWLQQTAPEQYAQIFPRQANPDDTSIPPEQYSAVAELPDELSFNYWVGERIGELMSSHTADRSFLAVAAFSVGAFMGTEPPNGIDNEALNERALQQADSAIGYLLTQLENLNIAENTVVLVTAGRGNAASDKSTRDTASYTMSEQALNVPLMLRYPGRAHTAISAPVTTVDIAPTILELAGLPMRQRLQGTSLLAVLNGKSPCKDWALSRLRRVSQDNKRNWQTALRAKNMKLIAQHGNPQSDVPVSYQLFDLASDPNEHIDLAVNEDYASALEDMIDLMIDARCALEDRTEPRIAAF